MGYDMYAIGARTKVPAGFVASERPIRPDDPWYFLLNGMGMGKMAEEMDRAGVLDLDTEHPPWPDHPEPYGEHFEDGFDVSERDADGTYERAKSLEGQTYLRARAELVRTLGEHGKVPAFKFETNDGWIVTPPECLWIAEALELRSLLLDEGRWRSLVEEFAAFNRRCGEWTDGYAVW